MRPVGLGQIQANVIRIVEHQLVPLIAQPRIQAPTRVLRQQTTPPRPQQQPLHHLRLPTNHQPIIRTLPRQITTHVLNRY